MKKPRAATGSGGFGSSPEDDHFLRFVSVYHHHHYLRLGLLQKEMRNHNTHYRA